MCYLLVSMHGVCMIIIGYVIIRVLFTLQAHLPGLPAPQAPAPVPGQIQATLMRRPLQHQNLMLSVKCPQTL